MRLQEIEAFLAVCKYGSFTKAAEKTFTTQPTISQQIASLEQEFGTQLVVRGKGRHQVVLTNAGQVFYPQAEKWVQLWKETKTILATSELEPYRFACVGSYTDHAFPAVHEYFSRLKLPCSLKLTGRTSMETIDGVESGKFDTGLVCMLRPSTQLNILPVASEKLFFVCRKDASYGDCVRVLDLDPTKQVRIIWTEEGRAWFEHWFGTKGKPFVEVNNIRNPNRYFSFPDAWGLLPASFLHNLDDDFRICRLDNNPPNRLFHLISRYPIREPFYSAVLDALIQEFSSIEGIKLLVDRS